MTQETNEQPNMDCTTGIVPSNNFLGLLPPPYSMASLKSTLPFFQNSSSASSSSSYTNTYIPLTSTINNNNNNSSNNHSAYSYRPNSTLTAAPTSTYSSNHYQPMSSTYRSSFSIPNPPSFHHQSREKEKFELSSLNDKFADYVEKVRYLEAQNKKVQLETQILGEKQQTSVQRTKSMFENELAQFKETVEKLLKDKNTMTYTAKDAQNALPQMRQRLNQTFKECDSSRYETEKVERQLSSIDGDIMMFKRRLVHQDDEYAQWKQLTAHMQRLLLQAKNETQSELLTRGTCEQATKQLRNDVTRLREQQQQKIVDLKNATFMMGSGSANDRAHTFKSELSSAIRKIRQDFERQNEQQRNDLYGRFTSTYQELAREHPDMGHLFASEREQERIRQEEERVRSEIYRVRSDMNVLKQNNVELKVRCREIQINLEMIADENGRLEQNQQQEIELFKEKQDKIANDYDDVTSKQTSLEKEIETYRNLLEGTMKTMVDTITEDFTAQTKPPTQQNGFATSRVPRSASVDRSSSSPYLSMRNGHNNSFSRFMTYKYNGTEPPTTNPTTASVVEIPTTIISTTNGGLATSKSVGDLTVKNNTMRVPPETNGTTTNGSSPPNSRPPTVLQTRRS